MTKIHKITPTIRIAKMLNNSGKKIVLVGGCFDILHIGHIFFLHQAKKKGEILILLLESNETVKRLKGEKRPINTQLHRAKVLEALTVIDYICLLPSFSTNKQYDELVLKLKPAIIATTRGDVFQNHKKRQAGLTGAKVVSIKKVPNSSSSKLAQSISEHFYL